MKKEDEEFYIGWQDHAPAGMAAFLKRVIPLTWFIGIFVAVGFVYYQSDFAASTFEYKQITMLEGTLLVKPVPMLLLEHGKDANGNAVTQEILLVEAGKHGAEHLIKTAEDRYGITLNGTQVNISGYLIYHDGHTLMEARDIQLFHRPASQGITSLSMTGSAAGSISGQIADPKCFFGVMKPGEGKVHLSCAARCIAGGIPPVLKSLNSSGLAKYYIVLNQDGEPVNQMILPYVGDHVFLKGQIRTTGDWDFILLDEGSPISRVTGDLAYQQMWCGKNL